MQVTVTRPLEETFNSVPGLDHVQAITSRGSAEIDLFFNWSVDMFQTLQSVNAAIARVQQTLPTTAVVTTNRLTFAAFPIMGYSLTSDSVPQTRLWELATYNIKPQLNRLPGVSSVVVQGGQEPEYEIKPDPEKLVEAQVTVPNLLDAISKSNLIDSPGLIERDHELVLALVNGQARNSAEIGGIVAKASAGGTPIKVKDVATVERSVKPVYTIVTANGKQAVLLNIFRQPDSNTVAVADQVHNSIEQLKKSLPAGTKVESFYDQSELVSDSIKSVRDAILIGLVLAGVILVLFLRDWGTSIVAGLVIPATIAVTFIAIRLMGESFNLMTLGGLAAAVGLVIDDAIVVVENIVMHRDNGQSRSEAIRSALEEIRKPLLGSTITPIVVFLPLISITGVTGTFFRALALTVGVALLTSLALALSWTPALSNLLLRSRPARPEDAPKHNEKATTGVMGHVTRLYERAIKLALARPLVLALLCVALIGASFVCFRSLGSDLLPAMDEGGFILDYLMPAGSSLADTNQVLVEVEKILHAVPEVENTSRRTGLQLGLAAVTEANTGDISVKLRADRHRGVEEVIADIRDKVNTRFPQLDTDFIQILQDQIGDLTSSPDPIQIKLFSENVDLLQRWAPKVADSIKTISAVKDVKNGIEDTISGPATTFNIDQGVTARAGFSAQEVELDASAIIDGEPAPAPIINNGRPYTLRVRFPAANRASLDAIQNTLLISGTGRVATLGTLATVQQDPGQLEIRRENLQRLVAVTGRLEGMSLGEGIVLVKQKVSALNIPSAIRVVYGGLYQEQQNSFHDLSVVLTAAVILVFIVLLIEFGDFAAPIAILSSALLSTSGVFLALYITKTTFNLSSFMGLIMVIGIVAKNGILLLDADQKFRAEGSNPRDAMIEAGERRLRPILMTALATIAGRKCYSRWQSQSSAVFWPPWYFPSLSRPPCTIYSLTNNWQIASTNVRSRLCLLACFAFEVLAKAQQPDVRTIIQRSVEANDRDFKAAPDYNYREHDKTAAGTKTYVVTMIDGSPYQRVIAINGKPLSQQANAEELRKQEQAAADRQKESADQRKERIGKYERDRARDHEMMAQLSQAFNFALVGKKKLRAFNVWDLKATPRSGYKPPNMDCQVLPGMQGELYIDQETFQWVKVTARVIKPVSIEGFLAQVQPGTMFEIEKSPVDGSIWQITHFVTHSRAKVLFVYNKIDAEEDNFYDFKPASN
jgi:multidrug efflux pump subunit AcrB